jgi:hypothetical protein
MSFGTYKIDKEQQSSDLANQIATALQGIRFGSVEIIVHEGKVVQIERKEKLRFDNRRTVPDKSIHP